MTHRNETWIIVHSKKADDHAHFKRRVYEQAKNYEALAFPFKLPRLSRTTYYFRDAQNCIQGAAVIYPILFGFNGYRAQILSKEEIIKE